MNQELKDQIVEKESALENPEVIVEKLTDFEHYLEKNSKKLGIAAGVMALVIAGFFGYKYWMGTQNDEAQAQMYSAIYYFEADSLKKALNGDGNNLGFLTIAEDYSM